MLSRFFTLDKSLVNHCARCDGLLYLESIAFSHDQYACINCGARTDATILRNRARTVPLRFPQRKPRQFPILVTT